MVGLNDIVINMNSGHFSVIVWLCSISCQIYIALKLSYNPAIVVGITWLLIENFEC